MKQEKGIALLLGIFLMSSGWLFPSGAEAWGRGHFYVIGTGPAGPKTATMQALDTIKKMDAILAPEKHAKLFRDYIGATPVLFDPWKGFWDYKGKGHGDFDRKEAALFKEERFRLRDERVGKIKDLLGRGKDVGLLDYGNPCLFSPSHWYVEHFDPKDLVIIPGMGCDAAAMAALGRSTIPSHDTRFVMQAAPFFLMGREETDRQLLSRLSGYPITMILYMALQDPEALFKTLSGVLPLDMPCAVVYWAGYPDRERVVRGTIGNMGKKLATEEEKYMGLLFIGRFLEGRPYESAMKGSRERAGK